MAKAMRGCNKIPLTLEKSIIMVVIIMDIGGPGGDVGGAGSCFGGPGGVFSGFLEVVASHYYYCRIQIATRTTKLGYDSYMLGSYILGSSVATLRSF